MRPSITLQQVLDEIDNGTEPFSITYVTCDTHRKTGGELVTLTGCYKHDYVSKEEKAKLAKAQPLADVVNKNPHHYENSTRNFSLPNGQVRKAHIRLITRFNNATVL